jgi:hypothetical protein
MTAAKCVRCACLLGEEKKIFFIEREKVISHTSEKDARVCDKCYDLFSVESNNRKQCTQCVYASRKETPLTGATEVYCKKIDMSIYSTHSFVIFDVGRPWRMRTFHFIAEKCVHYETENQYMEKALRGDVGTKEDTHLIVCKYCSCRYDQNQNIKCPVCGALNTWHSHETSSRRGRVMPSCTTQLIFEISTHRHF